MNAGLSSKRSYVIWLDVQLRISAHGESEARAKACELVRQGIGDAGLSIDVTEVELAPDEIVGRHETWTAGPLGRRELARRVEAYCQNHQLEYRLVERRGFLRSKFDAWFAGEWRHVEELVFLIRTWPLISSVGE